MNIIKKNNENRDTAVDFREFKNLLKEGYIDKEGNPLKCTVCNSTEFEDYNKYYMDNGIIEEYSVRCKKCKQFLGHWAYGYWEMF